MLGQRSSKRVAFTCFVGQDSNSSMVKSQLEEEAHKGDTVLVILTVITNMLAATRVEASQFIAVRKSLGISFRPCEDKIRLKLIEMEDVEITS